MRGASSLTFCMKMGSSACMRAPMTAFPVPCSMKGEAAVRVTGSTRKRPRSSPQAQAITGAQRTACCSTRLQHGAGYGPEGPHHFAPHLHVCLGRDGALAALRGALQGSPAAAPIAIAIGCAVGGAVAGAGARRAGAGRVPGQHGVEVEREPLVQLQALQGERSPRGFDACVVRGAHAGRMAAEGGAASQAAPHPGHPSPPPGPPRLQQLRAPEPALAALEHDAAGALGQAHIHNHLGLHPHIEQLRFVWGVRASVGLHAGFKRCRFRGRV